MAVLGTSLLVLVALVHISYVCDFDPASIRAVLSVVDPVQTLLATATAAVPGVALVLGLGQIARGGVWPSVKRLLHSPYGAPLLGITLLIGAQLVFRSLDAFVAIALAVMALISWPSRRRMRTATQEERQQAARERGTEFVTLALLIFFGTILSQPWTPSEVFELKEGVPVVGHVMGVQEGRFLVLLEEAGQVIWIDSGAITDRRLCNAGSAAWYSRSLSDVWDDTDYPRCPQA